MDSEEYVAKMEAMLKPCPWCGSKARFMYAPESWVKCSKCNAQTGMRSNERGAVEDWNHLVMVMSWDATEGA